ncbi:MAG: GH3 auxin-responsive promoter family protein [Candidatus Binatia bacterium]
MTEPWGYFVASSLWVAAGLRRTRVFHTALRRPRAVQEARLLYLLKHNERCEYGRRYRFDRLRTVRDYQNTVPVVTYDCLQDEIATIKRGRQGILTDEPVVWMEKTTGSTGASKYIPYTSSLKREFQAALAPWISDLYLRRRRMLLGGSYWSISPLAAEGERTEGGLSVGCTDEREYFSALERRLLEQLILTPRDLARIPDVAASRYVTLRFLLQTPHLSFISVWNPSFLTLLIHFLRENAEQLIADIRGGTLTPLVSLPSQLHATLSRCLSPRPKRARALEEILRRHGKLPPSEVWPNLALISCWASANARSFLPEVQQLFPGVEIQAKGLLATEGVISIPLFGHKGGALALTSHFFEFIPANSPCALPLLADELEAGRTYKVLLTTGGGLYRYLLGDLIQVVGKIHHTPLIEFIGKEDFISDLCGEKLHAARVETILADAFREFQLAPRFAMMAPEWGQPPRYVLFIDAPDLSANSLAKLVGRVEQDLSEGHHYSYCRRLGQLAPLRTIRVRDGARRYLERCRVLGQRLGNVKPTGLHCQTGWLDWFEPAAEDESMDCNEPLRL